MSEEKLGPSRTLQIPPATYKFLQVTTDNSVKPSDVLGVTSGVTRMRQAIWRALGSDPMLARQGELV